MRNLLSYPVTYQEAQEYLDQLLLTISTESELACGDMRPVIITWIKEKLEKHQLVEPWHNPNLDKII